jgi:tetratricopeptide (TPR) repeat protein
MDKADDEERGKPAGDGGATALGIALDAARAGPVMAEDARNLLREQARLARIQADQLDEEAALTRWSLRLRHAGEVMKFAFQLSVALMVLAIVAALGTAVWSAAHDNGLVIEAFSVPPDLVSRGLSGEVVASQLLDKLTRMQAETNSIRPAGTYRNNWGDDIKVEIPDTGISIGELNRYLRHWLGHETHITGEIYRVPAGIAVTARGRDAGTTFIGKDTDVDALLQKAAEAIYAETQPYRYAAFLDEMGREAEAVRVLKQLAAEASPAERAWADSLLGNLYTFFDRPAEALATLRAGVAADPSNAHAFDNLANDEQSLGHLEDAYQHTAQALRLYDKGSVAFDPERVAIIKLQDLASLAGTLGDFPTAETMDESIRQLPDRGGSQDQAAIDEAVQAAQGHDLPRAHSLLASVQSRNVGIRLNLWFETAGVAYFARDWRTLAHQFDPNAISQVAPASFHQALQSIFVRIPDSLLADAKAEQGDITGARRLIAATPLDCYDCVRLRGRIETTARNWPGAARWYALAAHEAPSIPMAFSDWGMMLLAKGDVSGAIAKFSAANTKGPRFADPLEGWGEALMQANRSDLALAKFEAANRLAPNWGRLHLEWGEALFYLGRKNGAQAQWNLAAGLDLTMSDRAKLARLRAS